MSTENTVEVAWLHLLKRDTWMRAAEIYLAAVETSMVNLEVTTKGLNLNLVTAAMRALCAQGKVEEKEASGDQGHEPVWKLAGEQPDILPEAALLPRCSGDARSTSTA